MKDFEFAGPVSEKILESILPVTVEAEHKDSDAGDDESESIDEKDMVSLEGSIHTKSDK